MLELVLVGDTGVGKSALLDRFCHDTFSFAYHHTEEINFTYKTLEENGRKVRLQIWDGPGKIEQNLFMRLGLNGPIGVILMFSLENNISFQNLTQWMEVLTTFSNKLSIVIVSNKRDGYEQAVNENEIQEFATKYHLKHYQVNIKEDFDVDQPFLELVSQMTTLTPKEVVKNCENFLRIQKEANYVSESPSLETLDLKSTYTNISTKDHTLTGTRTFLKGSSCYIDNFLALTTEVLHGKANKPKSKDKEEIESLIRKIVKEFFSISQNGRLHPKTAGAPEMRPLDEILLEYKQELLDLGTDFTNFRFFIANEMERMNQTTKALLEELTEEKELVLDNLETIKENVQMDTVYEEDKISAAKAIEEEVYGLSKKLESCEKKMSDGICYIENKVKLLSSSISKEITQKLDLMFHTNIISNFSCQNQENDGVGLCEKTSEETQTKKISLFNPFREQGRLRRERSQSSRIVSAQITASDSLEIKKIHSAEAIRKGATHSFEDDSKNDKFLNLLDCGNSISKGPNSATSLNLCSNDDELATKSKEEEAVEGNQENDQSVEDKEENGDEPKDEEYKENESFGEEPAPKVLEQEIKTIWNTINQIVNNTQDYIQEIKGEILNRSMAIETQQRVSVSPKNQSEQEQKNENDFKLLLTEVKDDVHNQIIKVQKELEGEVISLKDTILCQYASLSENIKNDQDEIKRYIDHMVEQTIEEVLLENAESSINESFLRLKFEDDLDLTAIHKPLFVSFEDEQQDVVLKENNGSERDLEKDVSILQSRIETLEEEKLRSIWNSISILANRLDKVEKTMKLTKQ